MKKIILIAFSLVISFSLRAQLTTDDISLVQSIWGKEKRTIVAEYMKLSSTEEAGFWKEYEVYEAARKELAKERLLGLEDYANNFEKLSAEKATELVKKAVDINISLQKLQLKTFSQLSKVMSPVRAAQFIQLENYFGNVTQLYIQENIPFIGELDELMNK